MQGDQMEKTDMYKAHEKLVYSMAWRFSTKTGIDIEELISEFNLVFCESFEAFEPSKGVKFSLFFCGNCRRRLCNLLTAMKRKKRKNEVLFSTLPEVISHDPVDSVILYDNFVNSKNPVISSIVSIVSIYALPKKGFRKWLRGILHEFGHTSKDIADAFRTLRSLYDPK